MSRKKKETILHPLTALDGLAQFNEDVSFLLSAVHTSIHLLTMDGVDIAKAANATVPSLQEAMDRVRRHYEAQS